MQKAPHADISLMAQAYRLGVPVTVHIAIGTDIVHMHPSANGAALGETSLRDFRILTAAMRSLSNGGVLLNLGSAVILPEVLLKAIATLRNQDAHFANFLGVDVDFAVQYRAHQQLVQRVEAIGGAGSAADRASRDPDSFAGLCRTGSVGAEQAADRGKQGINIR